MLSDITLPSSYLDYSQSMITSISTLKMAVLILKRSDWSQPPDIIKPICLVQILILIAKDLLHYINCCLITGEPVWEEEYALERLWHNAVQPTSTEDFSLEAVAVLFTYTILKFYPCEFAKQSIDQRQKTGQDNACLRDAILNSFVKILCSPA